MSSKKPSKNRSKNKTKGALYLYAVINGKENKNYGPIGILGKDVYTIYQGDMAAVVSRLKSQRLRPERRHMSAHHKVLTTLVAEQTPMPVAFGMIAQNPTALKKVLSDKQEILKQAYERVRGRLEMVLRVRLETENVYEYFVDHYPDLMAARDQVYGGVGEPGRKDRLELGHFFDEMLSEKRDTLAETVEQSLSETCVEITKNKCRDERDMMDLSCLVDRGTEDQFKSAVMTVEQNFDSEFAFDLKGPWVPHSFVDLQLDI